MSAVRPTAFHVRTAEHNRSNAWTRRGAFTVPAYFSEPQQEALAARVSSVLFDASALEELRVHGDNAASFLATACGSAVHAIAPGRSALLPWCADGGGVRGWGEVVRFGKSNFLLRSVDCDQGWFMASAPRFAVTVREATLERGLLILAGPHAGAVLSAAGFDDATRLEPDEHTVQDWRGVSVLIARDARLNAYLLSCAAEDGVVIFDRVQRAGWPLGLRLGGQEAYELLQLEAGLPLPHVDFEPARESVAAEPSAASLGLAKPAAGARVLMGLEFDSDEPCAFASVFDGRKEVGRTLRSAYSLALRRAIALAQIDAKHAVAGTALSVRRLGKADAETVPARVIALPFL